MRGLGHFDLILFFELKVVLSVIHEMIGQIDVLREDWLVVRHNIKYVRLVVVLVGLEEAALVSQVFFSI